MKGKNDTTTQSEYFGGLRIILTYNIFNICQIKNIKMQIHRYIVLKTSLNNMFSKILYMFFDSFLLAVESCDLKLTKLSYECLLSQSLLMGSRTSFSVSQQLRYEFSVKFLTFNSHKKKKWEKWSCKFLNDRIDQNINFAKLPGVK